MDATGPLLHPVRKRRLFLRHCIRSYWLETEHLPRQARGKRKETLRNKTLLQDAPPPPPNRWGPVPPPREVTVHDMEVEWSHKYGDSQLPALREVYP
jgi:hypothetical protein